MHIRSNLNGRDRAGGEGRTWQAMNLWLEFMRRPEPAEIFGPCRKCSAAEDLPKEAAGGFFFFFCKFWGGPHAYNRRLPMRTTEFSLNTRGHREYRYANALRNAEQP